MKTYIIPAIDVVEVKACTVIATSGPTFGSGTTQTMESNRRIDFSKEEFLEDMEY